MTVLSASGYFSGILLYPFMGVSGGKQDGLAVAFIQGLTVLLHWVISVCPSWSTESGPGTQARAVPQPLLGPVLSPVLGLEPPLGKKPGQK